MNKFFLAVTLGLGLSAGAAHAIVVPFTIELNGGDGSVVDGGSSPIADFSATMFSNDNGVPDITTTFSAVAPEDVDVSFNWTYQTFDIDGSSFDPFGYFVDAVFVQLSDDLPPPAFQFGPGTFSVLAGQAFGFWTAATNGILGRSLTTIQGTITPSAVPVPAAGLLLVGALGGLAALRRRKAIAA